MRLIMMLSLLIGGGAFASSFAIDDSAFDYFSSDKAYTTLDFQDGVFTLSLSEEAADPALRLSDIEFLPLDEDEQYHEAGLSRYLPVELSGNSVKVSYDGGDMRAIMSAYDEQLSGLGFSSSVENKRSSQTVMVYEQGETRARVIFNRQGQDVTVVIHAL